MDDKNKKVVSVGKVSIASKSVDGERRIVFVASSDKEDRHYETVDVGSLRLPLKGGGDMLVSSIPEGGVSDVIDIPLMLNHSGDVQDIIGSVRSARYENGELIFECGVSSTDDAQKMLTLLEEGHLNNAFSITMIDYDWNPDANTISNAEVIEVSLVYRGANKEARLLAIKSLLGGNMDEKDVANENNSATEPQVEEQPTTEAKQPTDGEAETTETTTEPEVAEETEAKSSKKEADAETESEESDENNNDNNEGESKMDETATKQVVAKATAPVQTTSVTDYLNSKEAVRDFALTLKSMAGKDAGEVKDAWSKQLKAKGITNSDALLPGALVNAISDTLKESGTIWNTIDKTGLTVFRTAVNTTGIDKDDGRAHGHKAGTTKKEESITFVERVIRGQYIYKYLTLNKEDIRENQDTGALVTYVLTELPKRVVAEIERAIVIGDGRSGDDKITSFVSLKADAADGSKPFATTYTPAKDEPLYKSIVRAQAQISADGEVYLVMSKAAKAELALAENNGGLVFPLGSDLATALGVTAIFTPSWMNDTNDKDNGAYLYVGNAYKGVGDNSTESFTNFSLKENKQEYLEEVYAGGALAEAGGAVAIKNAALES